MSNNKDRIAKVVTGFHRFMFSTTNGRVGSKIAGMPVVMLTTTGRKSGRKRTTMLTTPVATDDKVVLVASYGGDPRHPTWFLNLREHPEVELTRAGRKRKMRARVATPEEKTELWPEVTGVYKGYAQYQTRTTRDIPLVILEPV